MKQGLSGAFVWPVWWPSLTQQGVGVRCTAREGGAGGGKLKVRGVLDGDAPSFEAACKLAALFVVAEGGSPGPLCHAPPRGCSCQVAGSSEPLSHPRPLPSGQRAGLAPKVLRECWELAGVADGPGVPLVEAARTSPRVQASWPQPYQPALARPHPPGTLCPTCPLANKGQGPPRGSSCLHDRTLPGNTWSFS